MRKWLMLYLSILIAVANHTNYAFNDPTKPPASLQAQAHVNVNTLTLNAIIIKDGKKSAIINGIHVYEQGEIFGQRLIEINKNFVVLEGANARITLMLWEKPVSKRQSSN